MSFWKKAVVWLGLNEEYPDSATDPAYADEDWDRDEESAHAAMSPGPKRHADESIDPLEPAPVGPERDRGGVRVVPMDETTNAGMSAGAGAGGSAGAGSGTVRAVPMEKAAPPQVVIPASFNNAQDVADVFMKSTPVVVDLRNAERDLARRLIDFSAGLCYGLAGKMEKLAADLYLLIPEGATVSDEDRELHAHS